MKYIILLYILLIHYTRGQVPTTRSSTQIHLHHASDGWSFSSRHGYDSYVSQNTTEESDRHIIVNAVYPASQGLYAYQVGKKHFFPSLRSGVNQFKFAFRQDVDNAWAGLDGSLSAIEAMYLVVLYPEQQTQGEIGRYFDETTWAGDNFRFRFPIQGPFNTSEYVEKSVEINLDVDLSNVRIGFYIDIGSNTIDWREPNIKMYFKNMHVELPEWTYQTTGLITPECATEYIVLPRPGLPNNFELDGNGLPQRIESNVNCQPGSSDRFRAPSNVQGIQEVTLSTGNVYIDEKSFDLNTLYKITVPTGSVAIFVNVDLEINVAEIVVEGKLQMGTIECPINSKQVINFHGNSSFASDNGNTKGMMVWGELEIYGERYYPTWTKLATSYFAGDEVVILQEPVNWKQGQEILITTTVFLDEEEWTQNEIRTIVQVDDSRKVILMDKPLDFFHYGGQEYQAIVGLLTRNIVFNGENGAGSEGFGGHILIRGSAKVSGIELVKMGQLNTLARYPFHWHILGRTEGQYLEASSIRDSYFRCVTIHGTHNITLHENVAYNANGNCYYLEDGVETYNNLTFNLAVHPKPLCYAPDEELSPYLFGGGQGGWNMNSNQYCIQPADSAAAGLYISNALNRVVGNAAIGGVTGIAFPILPRPIGAHTHVDIVPSDFPTLEVDGNIAGCSGSKWSMMGSIYTGAQLTLQGDGITLRYQAGRTSRGGATTFTNTQVYLSTRSISSWGSLIHVYGYEGYDNLRGAPTIFGIGSSLTDALIVGYTNNPGSYITTVYGEDPRYYEAFKFYDTWQATLIGRVEVRNFQPFHPRSRARGQVFTGMTHSDRFIPQFITAVGDITYNNVHYEVIFNNDPRDTQSSRMFSATDFDGSVSLRGKKTIIGSDSANYLGPECCKDPEWNQYICAEVDKYELNLFSIRILLDGQFNFDDNGCSMQVTRGECAEDIDEVWLLEGEGAPGCYIRGMWDRTLCEGQGGQWVSAISHHKIGRFALWGPGLGHNYESSTVITHNGIITSLIGKGIYHAMYFENGAPNRLEIETSQFPTEQWNSTILALPYPLNTQFSIRLYSRWFQGQEYGNVSAVGSLTELENLNYGYYFDNTEGFLYVRLTAHVNIGRDYYQEEKLSQEGVKIPPILSGFNVLSINADFGEIDGGIACVMNQTVQYCDVEHKWPNDRPLNPTIDNDAGMCPDRMSEYQQQIDQRTAPVRHCTGTTILGGTTSSSGEASGETTSDVVYTSILKLSVLMLLFFTGL